MNKNSKHNKIKNTGILFELLTRQITSDILNNIDKSKAIGIIKKYFNKNTMLSKELVLYNSLITEKYNTEDKAVEFINMVSNARRNLNTNKLKEEKYNLVKEINEAYNLKDFFKTPLNNYKLLASIYKLFEYAENKIVSNPSDVLNSKYTLVEHIAGISKNDNTHSATTDDFIEEYKKEDKNTRLLSYKILVNKFNTKYNVLNEKQKMLLKKYINNVSNTNSLLEYMTVEIPNVKSELMELVNTIPDKVRQIKINEVAHQLDNLIDSKTVKDNQVLSLLKYYELIKELKDLK